MLHRATPYSNIGSEHQSCLSPCTSHCQLGNSSLPPAKTTTRSTTAAFLVKRGPFIAGEALNLCPAVSNEPLHQRTRTVGTSVTYTLKTPRRYVRTPESTSSHPAARLLPSRRSRSSQPGQTSQLIAQRARLGLGREWTVYPVAKVFCIEYLCWVYLAP